LSHQSTAAAAAGGFAAERGRLQQISIDSWHTPAVCAQRHAESRLFLFVYLIIYVFIHFFCNKI